MHTNVLIITATMKKGGAERVISLLLKEWCKNKKIKIFLILMENGIEYDIPSSITPLVLSDLNKTNLRKFLELPLVSWRVAKFIRDNSIDLAISFLYRPNYVNLMVNFLFKTKHKVIINVRSATSRYLREGLLGRINIFLVRALFNKADLIISNSNGVENDLSKILNINTQKKVIYNPVDIDHINLCKNIIDDTKYKFNINKKYIISMGRLIPLKRNMDLIDAFNFCQKKHTQIKLIFLGDGQLRNDLENYCIKLKIEDKVTFLGNVSNPFYYLSRSDLFVHSSEIEGFPNALIEAMACSLPVISSNCISGPDEILDNGKYGMLYKVGDVSALASKIDNLLSCSKSMSYYSNMSTIRSKNFNIENILPEYTKLINSIK